MSFFIYSLLEHTRFHLSQERGVRITCSIRSFVSCQSPDDKHMPSCPQSMKIHTHGKDNELHAACLLQSGLQEQQHGSDLFQPPIILSQGQE